MNILSVHDLLIAYQPIPSVVTVYVAHSICWWHSIYYIYIYHDFKHLRNLRDLSMMLRDVLHDSSGLSKTSAAQEMCLLYAEGDPATGAELGRTVVDPSISRFCLRKHQGKIGSWGNEHFCPSNPRAGVRFQFSLEAIGSMSSEIETPGKRRVKNDGDILKLEPVLVRIWGFSPPKKDMIYVPQWCMEFSYAKSW